MHLADSQIHAAVALGQIGVSPFTPEHVQPASLDLTLGSSFWIQRLGNREIVDPWDADHDPAKFGYRVEVRPEDNGFVLEPMHFVLGTTVESIKLPADILARVDGRSSIGRLGIMVHSTAGFIDPGFEGQITLELSNVSRYPVRLYPGKRICQICFTRMEVPAERPYGPARNSKYQGQVGPQPSQIKLDR